MILGLARRRLLEYRHEFVAPVDLGGQVGLPRHEGVAELRGALKCYDELCIHLWVTDALIRQILAWYERCCPVNCHNERSIHLWVALCPPQPVNDYNPDARPPWNTVSLSTSNFGSEIQTRVAKTCKLMQKCFGKSEEYGLTATRLSKVWPMSGERSSMVCSMMTGSSLRIHKIALCFKKFS